MKWRGKTEVELTEEESSRGEVLTCLARSRAPWHGAYLNITRPYRGRARVSITSKPIIASAGPIISNTE